MDTKLKPAIRQLTHHLKVCKLVLKDTHAPKQAKIILGFAVAYIPFPFGFIISPILIIIVLRMIPKEVIEGCKVRANS
ncbi:MAG: hypothetical protein O7C75_17700 [Verrucomicrobia bacterium]|nr:hypothetical protein [Verrucomicrobiota bacterium]